MLYLKSTKNKFDVTKSVKEVYGNFYSHLTRYYNSEHNVILFVIYIAKLF